MFIHLVKTLKFISVFNLLYRGELTLRNSLLALGSFVLVLALAFYFTKFLSKKLVKIESGKNIKIMEMLTLDTNNRIAIIKVINSQYLISISSSGIKLLDKIEIDTSSKENFKTSKNSNQNFKNDLNIFYNTINDKKDLLFNENVLSEKKIYLKNFKEKLRKINIVDKDV